MPTPVQSQIIRNPNRQNNFYGQASASLFNPFLGGIGQAAGRAVGELISPNPQAEFARAQTESLRNQTRQTYLNEAQRIGSQFGYPAAQQYLKEMGMEGTFSDQTLGTNARTNVAGEMHRTAQGLRDSGGRHPFSPRGPTPEETREVSPQSQSTQASQQYLIPDPTEDQVVPTEDVTVDIPIEESVRQSYVDPSDADTRKGIREQVQEAEQDAFTSDFATGVSNPTSPNHRPVRSHAELARRVNPPLNPSQRQKYQEVMSFPHLSVEEKQTNMRDIILLQQHHEMLTKMAKGESVEGMLPQMARIAESTDTLVNKMADTYLMQNPIVQEMTVSKYLDSEFVDGHNAYTEVQIKGRDNVSMATLDAASRFTKILDRIPEHERPTVMKMMAGMKEAIGMTPETASAVRHHRVAEDQAERNLGLREDLQQHVSMQMQLANDSQILQNRITQKDVDVLDRKWDAFFRKEEMSHRLLGTDLVMKQTRNRTMISDLQFKENFAPLQLEMAAMGQQTERATGLLMAAKGTSTEIAQVMAQQASLMNEFTGKITNPTLHASLGRKISELETIKQNQMAMFNSIQEELGDRDLLADIQEASNNAKMGVFFNSAQAQQMYDRDAGFQNTSSIDALADPEYFVRDPNTGRVSIRQPGLSGALLGYEDAAQYRSYGELAYNRTGSDLPSFSAWENAIAVPKQRTKVNQTFKDLYPSTSIRKSIYNEIRKGHMAARELDPNRYEAVQAQRQKDMEAAGETMLESLEGMPEKMLDTAGQAMLRATGTSPGASQRTTTGGTAPAQPQPQQQSSFEQVSTRNPKREAWSKVNELQSRKKALVEEERRLRSSQPRGGVRRETTMQIRQKLKEIKQLDSEIEAAKAKWESIPVTPRATTTPSPSLRP